MRYGIVFWQSETVQTVKYNPSISMPQFCFACDLRRTDLFSLLLEMQTLFPFTEAENIFPSDCSN